MKQTVQSIRRFRFGTFEADLQTGELTKLDKRISLQDQPFQLLAMLLEKPRELVSRQELSERLWPNTIVDFDHGLNKAIGKVREALGDSAETPRFIETVARRGYRFLADVAVVQGGQPETAAGDLATHEGPGLRRPSDAAHQQGGRPMLSAGGFTASLSLWRLQSPWLGSSIRGDTHCPRSVPWQCCRWKTFPTMRLRTISPTE
jgi:DNA-binding winged helix-turn-helix (wHTH) protein